jgi:predicted DNA-binding transcriptional regulator YafY
MLTLYVSIYAILCGMRASRLISILLLLQTRGRMTAQALADELEVSVRTVYRDVDSLSEAGVPIYGDRGPDGGYQLIDGYQTRLTGLTADEAETLFLAGMPGPAAELGLGTVLAAAQLKLMAALPPELRSRAGRIRERFHLDAPGWFQESEQPPYLAIVADAVWNQRPLEIRYERWGGVTVERTVEPLGVVLKAGSWYLVAAVEGQSRTYRVSRLLDVQAVDGHFERPEEFDLVTYWQSWSEDFLDRLYRYHAVVRLSPRAIDMLPVLFSRVAARNALASAEPPDAEVWVRLTIPIESSIHAPVELLRFGADAEVISPPELREEIAAAARGLVALYCADVPAIGAD